MYVAGHVARAAAAPGPAQAGTPLCFEAMTAAANRITVITGASSERPVTIFARAGAFSYSVHGRL